MNVLKNLLVWIAACAIMSGLMSGQAAEQGFKPARPAATPTPIPTPHKDGPPAEESMPKDLENATPSPDSRPPLPQPVVPAEQATEPADLQKLDEKTFLEVLDKRLAEISIDFKSHGQLSDAKALQDFREFLQRKETQNFLRKLSAEEQHIMLTFVNIIANQRSDYERKLNALIKAVGAPTAAQPTPAGTVPAAAPTPAPTPTPELPQEVGLISEFVPDFNTALINAGENKGLKVNDEILVYRDGKIVATGVIKIVKTDRAQAQLEPVSEDTKIQKGDIVRLRK